MTLIRKDVLLLLLILASMDCLANVGKKEWVQSDSIAVLLRSAQKNTYKKPELAEKLAMQAYEMAIAQNQAVEQGEALRIIGGTFYIRGDYDLALNHFLEAYQVFEETKDTLKMTRALSNLGLVYKSLEDYDRSLAYYNKGLKYCKTSDTLTLSKIYNNIGVVYKRQLRYDSASYYFSKSLLFKRHIGDKKGVANTLTNLGNVAADRGENDKAITLFRQSLKLESELGNDEGEAKNLNNIANAHIRLGRLDSAIHYAELGLEIGRRLQTKIQIKESTEVLAQAYAQKNSYRLAYDYQQLYVQYKDSMMNEDVSRKIGRLESKLEMAKQRSEIERLTLENQLQTSHLSASKNRTIWISFFSLIILVAGIIIYLLRLRAYKIESLAQASQLDALQKRYLELVNGPASFDLTVALPELNKQLFNPLTQREYEILHLSLQGRTNKQIAEKLFVSLSTVKFHLRNTYSKLGVNNRKEALEYVFKIS